MINLLVRIQQAINNCVDGRTAPTHIIVGHCYEHELKKLKEPRIHVDTGCATGGYRLFGLTLLFAEEDIVLAGKCWPIEGGDFTRDVCVAAYGSQEGCIPTDIFLDHKNASNVRDFHRIKPGEDEEKNPPILGMNFHELSHPGRFMGVCYSDGVDAS